ncbi:MAG: deoxyribose-phosphate aldolase [Anaerolineaceae bacterium 4572_78]|nr:MAG: deoxyribose-phosphate aldolase [Anaerolineaceae bacterium 4572_78]
MNNNIAKYIDHTLLKPVATQAQILTLCQEAIQHKFKAVCVNPVHVKLAREKLDGTDVNVCTVVGFPLGANLTDVKVYETEKALADGADEIDMVINIGALKDGNDSLVQDEIARISQTAHDAGAICKVILETVLLTDDEKVRACKLAKQASWCHSDWNEFGCEYLKRHIKKGFHHDNVYLLPHRQT